ncbi:hypothetical protein AWV80_02715 [Cupriavidus sp. UYMU48A]|nr:hypothetical protein AWV80_02715 [Cupriavidus sp. UYMU48A]
MTWIAAFQINANGNKDFLYVRQLAALGEKIEIHSPITENSLYPAVNPKRLSDMAAYADRIKLGPYASGWLRDVGSVIFDPTNVEQGACKGFLETVQRYPGFFEARGWVVPTITSDSTTLVLLVDAAGNTVGYGISGERRGDVLERVPGAAPDDGWVGFATAEPLQAYGYFDGKFCKLHKITATAQAH